MSFEILGLAYHCSIDKKIHLHAPLRIQCKRLNDVKLIKMLKQEIQTGFGAKSVFYVLCI